MKTTTYLLFAALAALLVSLSGCGLLSGTVFISQEVSGSVESNVGGTLDDTFAGQVVDFHGNDEWDRVDIDGVEDVCVRLTAENLLEQNVSGEVWITPGDSMYTTADQVRGNGFRVFHGLALGPHSAPNGTRTFTCVETLLLFENLDQLADAVANGVFGAWAIGDQNTYRIRYSGIVFGIHVTGSL